MNDTKHLRALRAAATPGEWKVDDREDCWDVVGDDGERAFSDGTAGGEYGPDCDIATRECIRAAVNSLVPLCDEVDSLRAQLAEAAQAAKDCGVVDLAPAAAIRRLSELHDREEESTAALLKQLAEAKALLRDALSPIKATLHGSNAWLDRRDWLLAKDGGA